MEGYIKGYKIVIDKEFQEEWNQKIKTELDKVGFSNDRPFVNEWAIWTGEVQELIEAIEELEKNEILKDLNWSVNTIFVKKEE